MADAPKSIAEAINDVSDADVKGADLEEATEEKGGTLLDEEDEGEKPKTDEGEARTGDVLGEGAEEEGEEEDEEEEEEIAADAEPDVIDIVTPEELSAIKADPGLNKLRKSLMRGYDSKTKNFSALVQLGQAYRADPRGVAEAIAKSVGAKLAPITPETAAAPGTPPPTSIEAAGKELEGLFGAELGPKVRAVFDKWADARFGSAVTSAVTPLRDALGRVVNQSEQARMMSEEQTFKARHRNLDADTEKQIVELGNSGKIIPGGMSPSEYLETLYEVVTARQARLAAKKAGSQASTKLAAKIESNRKDREPSGVSGRGGSVKPVSKIPQARNISEALDFAMDELEAEGG